MKTTLIGIALAATLAQPAAAITFPSLTTIYVGSGVFDNNGAAGQGMGTSVHCSNVSGVSVQVRVLVLSAVGAVEGSRTQTLLHGETRTYSTHDTNIFVEGDGNLATGGVTQGVVNVEATNSAVFCTAHIVDAAGIPPAFMGDLHLVRVNPHPGTVE